MSTIYKRDFSAGLCPSDDETNGRDNALLRMDNLCLDENGSIELMRGTQKITSVTQGVGSFNYIYSKILNGTKYRYGLLNNGVVRRSSGNFTSVTDVIVGGSASHAAFGNGFGNVFICSGTKKVKDVLASQQNLGIVAPGGAPTVASLGTGNLTGSYQYIQVYVNSAGSYVAQSGPSASVSTALASQSPTITPYTAGVDSQVTHCYWFRIGGTLPDYYFVGQTVIGLNFVDTTSDAQALLVNIKLNQFLQPVSSITDEILSIAGPFNGRMIYLTWKWIYISDIYNPDSYDTRMTIQLSSAAGIGEKNLFLAQHSNSTVIIGTTADLYEITGTLAMLPDGTFDVVVRALGIEQPPINETFAIESGTLFYIASDGLRFLNGTETSLVSNDLYWLFRGTARYGAAGFNIAGQNAVGYRLCAHRSKIWMLMYEIGGTASVYVYDLFKKNWSRFYNNPSCLFTEEDGTLIGGSSDGHLRQYDSTYLFDGITQLSINLRTTLSKDSPNQRKDPFLLKLVIDTGGSDVNVYMGNQVQDPSSWLVATVNTSGLTEVNLAAFQYTGILLPKRVSFAITSAGVSYFRLTEISLEYEPRPVQVQILRVPSTNYGAAGRKRITEVPFTIDTLGQPVSVRTVTDGVVDTAQTFTTDGKKTVAYLYPSERYANDVGLIISSNTFGNQAYPFEFYGMVEPKVIEVLPDAVSFYRIPATNLGTACRKRLFNFAITLNTFGGTVVFTPYIDGVAGTPVNITGPNDKRTYLHTFSTDTVGTDIWGTLSKGGGATFEFYGVNLEECVFEKLPLRRTFIYIPPNNFGIPAKKRIRTLPFEINTLGNDVTVTPNIDGVNAPGVTFNTNRQQTVFYYFETDVFGVDIGMTISGGSFEFYKLLTPENVETLPVSKLMDQIGPIELDSSGQLIEFKSRLITEGNSINYTVYMDDNSMANGTFPTTANVDKIYGPIKVPRGIIGTVCRIEFSSSKPFNRYWCKIKANLGGIKSDIKEFTFK